MYKRIFVNIFVISLVLIIINGCNSNSDKKYPRNGGFCFESKSTANPGYIHMNFLDGKVDGTIFLVEEVQGKVSYNFSGHIVNDTLMKLRVHMTAYEKVDVEQEWIIYWINNDIKLKNSMGRKEIVGYAMMSCAPFYQVVDTSEYASVEAVHEESVGERWENEFKVICFEEAPTLPDSNKRAQLHEYIQLRNNRGKITGWGFGTGEENLQKNFDLNGTLTNDSTMEVKVNYRQEGKPVLTVSQTWFIDEGRQHLRLNDNINGHTKTKIYNKTECPNELYFESTSPNANKATPLYEYLKISYLNEMVWGEGAGDFMMGSQPWKLFFRGVITENNMKLKVTYLQSGEVPFTVSETWTIDIKKGRLYRKDWAASKNSMGASEYHKIESHEVPKEYANSIEGIDPN